MAEQARALGRGLDRVDDPSQKLLPWQTKQDGLSTHVPETENDLHVDIDLEKVGSACGEYWTRCQINTLLPWGTFFFFFYITGMHLRVQYPLLINNIIMATAAAFLLTIWMLIVCCLPKSIPFISLHFMELGSLLTLACFFGLLFGNHNYEINLMPAYQQSDLAHHSGVNVLTMPSSSMSDTSQFHFVEGTHVETNKAMSYNGDVDTFCVAPITYRDEQLATYDYWAVGMNCCRTEDPIFDRCGEAKDPQARAGYRLMVPEKLAYFKLAIEQSEAEYGITAGPNPILLYWVKDPNAQAQKHMRMGLLAFLTNCLIMLPILHFLAVTSWLVEKLILQYKVADDDPMGRKSINYHSNM